MDRDVLSAVHRRGGKRGEGNHQQGTLALIDSGNKKVYFFAKGPPLFFIKIILHQIGDFNTSKEIFSE